MNENTPISSIREILGINDAGTITENRLSISNTTLQSFDKGKVVATMLKNAFGGQAVLMTEASANPSTDKSAIVISGRSSFELASTVITILTITLDGDDQVQLLFSFQMIGETPPPSPWKFSSSFSELPTVFNYEKLGGMQIASLDDFSLYKTFFYVSTFSTEVNGSKIDVGINFNSRVLPTGIFGLFKTVVNPQAELTFTGTIRLPLATSGNAPVLGPDQYPWDLEDTPWGISLALDIPVPAITLGTTMSLGLSKLRVYSPTSGSWLAKNKSYVPVIAYVGSLEIPSASIDAPLITITPPGTEEAKMLLKLDKSTHISDLTKLADLTGSSNLLDNLPTEIQKAKDSFGLLSIQSLSITLGLINKVPTVMQVDVVVGMPELNWSIWDPYFVIKSISSRFTIQSPFKNPELDVRVEGKLEIDGKKFKAVAIKNSGYQVFLSLSENVDIPLKSVMEKYVDALPPPSDLTINAITLTAAPNQFYSLMLEMAEEPNPWIIDVGIAQLSFTDIQLYMIKAKSAGLSGSISANASFAGLTLAARYDIPGDIVIRGDLPNSDLRTIISTLTDGIATLPGEFNLDFSQSYIMLKKQQSNYRWEMATLVEEFGSLAFVVEKQTSGWGFAAGVDISASKVANLKGVGDFVTAFEEWFPFNDFVLAASSLKDSQFSFPSFKQFNKSSLGQSKITLPSTVQGIDKGFYLYTDTTFTKKNKILGALIDLLNIPEGTSMQAVLAYLTEKQQLQLGISLSTFLTPVEDINKRTCQGDLGYDNGCFTGTLFVEFSGDNVSLGLSASVKTQIQGTNVDFTVIIALVENGIFVSGTMDNQKPLEFGPLSLGGVAIELGISFEGIPSVGFAGELDVGGAFDSSIAVLVDTSNPTNSMIAAALSNLSLGNVVDTLLGELDEEIPQALLSLLNTIAIEGTTDGAFTVPAADSGNFVKALNNFDGAEISNVFTQVGNLPSFPNSSEGLMLFVDTPDKTWYITEKSGGANSSSICHWQLYKQSNGDISVSKEAQFYFVPASPGTKIGKFFYPQGMLVAGRIRYLFIDLDVDIEMFVNKGIKVEAELGKIVIGNEKLFSITSSDGKKGPSLSLATYTQPQAPKEYQKPHFNVSGKIELLGISRSAMININSSGADFALDGDLIPEVLTGNLSGSIGENSLLDIQGSVFAGIGEIDLGPLGTYHIDTGVEAKAHVWGKTSDIGASLQAGFELAGDHFNLPEIKLDIATQSFADLPEIFFSAVKELLSKLFTDPKEWAKMANKALAWSIDEIKKVLSSGIFGHLDAKDIESILGTLCPVATALSVL